MNQRRESLPRPPGVVGRTDQSVALAAAFALASGASNAGATESVDDLLARIQNADETVSGKAWQSAEAYGAQAVRRLAGLLTHADFEIARKAKRALYRIVRHAGRPGAANESMAVQAQLISLLGSGTVQELRQLVWMLSEIAGPEALAPMAALLSDPEVREDARCALQRLPGKKVTEALKSAFKQAPEDFKFALADSLRKRGETVKGYPSRKLVPTRPT